MCVCNVLEIRLNLTILNHVWWFYHKKSDSKVLRMAILLKYFDEKKAKWRLQCLKFYTVSLLHELGGMSPHIPTVKVRVLTSDVKF